MLKVLSMDYCLCQDLFCSDQLAIHLLSEKNGGIWGKILSSCRLKDLMGLYLKHLSSNNYNDIYIYIYDRLCRWD